MYLVARGIRSVLSVRSDPVPSPYLDGPFPNPFLVTWGDFFCAPIVRQYWHDQRDSVQVWSVCWPALTGFDPAKWVNTSHPIPRVIWYSPGTTRCLKYIPLFPATSCSFYTSNHNCDSTPRLLPFEKKKTRWMSFTPFSARSLDFILFYLKPANVFLAWSYCFCWSCGVLTGYYLAAKKIK